MNTVNWYCCRIARDSRVSVRPPLGMCCCSPATYFIVVVSLLQEVSGYHVDVISKMYGLYYLSFSLVVGHLVSIFFFPL